MLSFDNVRSCYRVKRLISNPSLEKGVRSETRRKIRMRDQMQDRNEDLRKNQERSREKA